MCDVKSRFWFRGLGAPCRQGLGNLGHVGLGGVGVLWGKVVDLPTKSKQEVEVGGIDNNLCSLWIDEPAVEVFWAYPTAWKLCPLEIALAPAHEETVNNASTPHA